MVAAGGASEGAGGGAYGWRMMYDVVGRGAASGVGGVGGRQSGAVEAKPGGFARRSSTLASMHTTEYVPYATYS